MPIVRGPAGAARHRSGDVSGIDRRSVGSRAAPSASSICRRARSRRGNAPAVRREPNSTPEADAHRAGTGSGRSRSRACVPIAFARPVAGPGDDLTAGLPDPRARWRLVGGQLVAHTDRRARPVGVGGRRRRLSRNVLAAGLSRTPGRFAGRARSPRLPRWPRPPPSAGRGRSLVPGHAARVPGTIDQTTEEHLSGRNDRDLHRGRRIGEHGQGLGCPPAPDAADDLLGSVHQTLRRWR
jgi:hypothetical protein